MWDLSPRMAEARETFLNFKRDRYRLHKVIPYGVWTERIRKYRFEECEKHTLVFMGHLIEKQGVQLVIQAMPEILQKIPDFRFKIIGAGSFKNDLVKLAEDQQVSSHCDFKGKIADHRDLENEIARSCVAIAPYVKKFDTWTYYADPGKVKTYLACGVPVLLTDIPWNAKEIEKHRCGNIIPEASVQIALHILTLMVGETNQIYRDNAISYAQTYDYENIFRSLQI
jgi:glycosyltransferase involved in cell wall biosynthesis